MTRRLPSLAVQGAPASASVQITQVPVRESRTIRQTPASQQTEKEPQSSKTFVITGANRGIGLGLAKALSKKGHVIATARNPASAGDLIAIPNVSVLELDIASPASVADFAIKVGKLAPDGIDLLWNNAGMNAAKFAVTDDKIDAQGWVQELAVNCVGSTLVTNALLPLLRKANEHGDGEDKKIVFTSSICGSVASTSGKGTGAAYFSSKAAMNSSVKFWHYQMSEEGFVVVPIHPGWVKTDMGGPGAAVTVEESVKGMIKVVDSLNAKSELKLRVWDGSTLPW